MFATTLASPLVEGVVGKREIPGMSDDHRNVDQKLVDKDGSKTVVPLVGQVGGASGDAMVSDLALYNANVHMHNECNIHIV